MMNKIIMTAVLVKDAEIKEGKTMIAQCRGAVKRPYSVGGEVVSDYFNFIAFSTKAEFLKRFGKKGTKFEIIGYLKNSNYENSDGDMVYKDDIIIQEIDFAERRRVEEKEDIDEDYDEDFDDDDFDDLDDDLEDNPFEY